MEGGVVVKQKNEKISLPYGLLNCVATMRIETTAPHERRRAPQPPDDGRCSKSGNCHGPTGGPYDSKGKPSPGVENLEEVQHGQVGFRRTALRLAVRLAG